MFRRIRRFIATALPATLVWLGVLAPAFAHADGLTLFKQRRPQGQFGEAVAHLSQGRLKEADAIFKDIIENDPSQIYALLGRAQVSISQGNLPAAERSALAALQANPNIPEPHNVAGVIFLLQQKHAEARREFARAIELRPAYVTPRLYLAAMARAEGNFDQARQEYKTIVDLAPRIGAGYIGQAEANVMSGRTADAFTVLEQWKNAANTSVLPAQVIGTLAIVTGQPDRAVQELQLALTKQPRNDVTLRLLGDAYAAKNDSGRAIAQYRAALAVNAADLEAAMGLANMQIRTGERNGAVQTYRQILSRQPDAAVAANNLAWLTLEQGNNLPEAQHLAETAVKSAPGYVDGYDTLGWINYKRGQYKAAVTALEKAKSLAPDRADIAAHLGLAYAKAGATSAAIAELKRALQAKDLPNHQELEGTLQSLTSRP